MITTHVHTLNTDYTEPLPRSEAKSIAESIYRWITTRFYGWTDSRTVNEATFTAIQSARGHKSGEARCTARLDLFAAIAQEAKA